MKAAEHKKYLFEICEKIDLDLESPTCRKLREHLAQCPDCAAYYDSLKKTIVLYRNYDVEMKDSHVTEILSRLDLENDADAKQHIKIKLPKKPDA